MPRRWAYLIIVATALFGLATSCGQQRRTLFVHCAAGMMHPIQKLANEFEAKHGVRIEMAQGGANTLLAQIELTRRGDVYIAGDADYVDMAAQKGLIRSRRTLCYFVPVIMVAKGNPKNITCLADLTRPGIRIGQGDPRATAVGRLIPRLLERNGVDYAEWQKNVTAECPTVNELGVKVELRTIDAAVVWRVIALGYHHASEIIDIPRDKNICPEVAGAVLTCATNEADAQAFLDFLASERGRQVLTAAGYQVDRP